MVGLMQVGLGTAVVAAPLHNDGLQRIVQLDDRQQHDRQHQHDQRQRQENQRHEREMRRHNNEGEREWHDRQERENQQHDNTMHEIEAGLFGFVLGSVTN